MSWKPEIKVTNEETWHGNALRFNTKEEAEACALDTYQRWTLAREHRAVECTHPANYRWVDGKLQHITKEEREAAIYDAKPELLT